MSVERLHPADLERLAELVVDRLADRLEQPAPAALLTAAEVAERFGVSAAWVREHADELGAVRLGEGPRPRLRFDVATVADRLAARSGSERSVLQDRPAGRRKSLRGRPVVGDGFPLLPIRGPEA